MTNEITGGKLTEVDPAEIARHMPDPTVDSYAALEWCVGRPGRHLFCFPNKETQARVGLGHWPFLVAGQYVGWRVFRKEGDEWDVGLVLRPGSFGLGRPITQKAIQVAKSDDRVPYVTVLLPPSRTNLGALRRRGAKPTNEVEYDGARFLNFRLEMA